jgi:tRNA (guanine10-N2)-dimethyltransferase
MEYLAILGRQPEISIAEIEAQCLTGSAAVASSAVLGSQVVSPAYFEFTSSNELEIDRFGGMLKLAVKLEKRPLEFLQELPEGKITIGVSDYSKNASRKTATMEALKLKKILVRHGRSVRVVENKDAVLSTATSLHNGLSGKNERKVELIKVDDNWYRVVGVQDIDAYAKRDQARPARDAFVGMLPPKLAQILINLCGPLKEGSCVLDPFCGTGVVLQEALLMGYRAYGTDLNPRMIEYTKNQKGSNYVTRRNKF